VPFDMVVGESEAVPIAATRRIPHVAVQVDVKKVESIKFVEDLKKESSIKNKTPQEALYFDYKLHGQVYRTGIFIPQPLRHELTKQTVASMPAMGLLHSGLLPQGTTYEDLEFVNIVLFPFGVGAPPASNTAVHVMTVKSMGPFDLYRPTATDELRYEAVFEDSGVKATVFYHKDYPSYPADVPKLCAFALNI